MLTPERHQIILDLLKKREVVHVQELVEATGASESTIRRDLTELEDKRMLKRVHGGAATLEHKMTEPTFTEKSSRQEREKQAIAKYAADLVTDKDSIYLDAGTTTFHMIKYLAGKDIVVVTNGLNLAFELIKHQLKAIVLGGDLKAATLALVGRSAIESIYQYRFDKCFLGINAIDKEHGLTTPDPDEAHIKSLALKLSDESYILCDSSKFSKVSFAKVADIQDLQVITDHNLDQKEHQAFRKITNIKVVKA